MIDDNNKDVKAYSPFHLGKQKKIWNNMTEANLKNIVELLLLGYLSEVNIPTMF
jgi:hypothetical protein